MRRTVSFVAVVGVMLVCSALANAVGVQVKYVGITPSASVDITHPFVGSSPFLAGVYRIEVDLGDGNGALPFGAFCIDLKQSVSASFKPYNLAPVESAPLDGGSPYSPMGTAKANAIRELWGEHVNEIGSDGNKAAAFQVALWEIIYENAPAETPNPWDTGSGRFALIGSTDPAIISQANAWLGTIGDANQRLDTTLMALTNYTSDSKYQDYLISRGGGGNIPEPLTMASVLLGICGLGSYIRRRTAV